MKYEFLRKLSLLDQIDFFSFFFHVPTFNIHEHSIEEDGSYDTVSRCFHYAMLERGPVQLNIPRDMYYGDLVTTIPEPMKVDRSAGKYIYLELCTMEIL